MKKNEIVLIKTVSLTFDDRLISKRNIAKLKEIIREQSGCRDVYVTTTSLKK